MDLMNSIASQAMSMKQAQLGQQYSISVAKKAMETQELALQEVTEMLPQTPRMGVNLDVYA